MRINLGAIVALQNKYVSEEDKTGSLSNLRQTRNPVITVATPTGVGYRLTQQTGFPDKLLPLYAVKLFEPPFSFST